MTNQTAEQAGKPVEQLTHWKKNNDPRYISGEDLKDGLAIGKGLRPEMVVCIEKFEDSETYDQQKNAKTTKTGFWLTDLQTKTRIYKPLILNNTNAAFCRSEFKSDYMEHWIGQPMVLFALPDKRHGHVARLKKYYPPVQATPDKALAELEKCATLADLTALWGKLSAEEKKLPAVIAKKDELKGVLK